MTTTALANLMMPLLEDFGRWLFVRIRNWGLDRTIDFIEMRIDVISDRRKRVMNKPPPKKKGLRRARASRLAWMAWRIRWRKRLLAKLRKHRKAIESKALGMFERVYKKQLKRIPWDKAGEKFETWKRRGMPA